jgi:uncharacterized membrane protein
MDEVFPVLCGIAVGLVFYYLPSSLRVVTVVVLGVAFGWLAAWISGELAISWVYVLIDTAQVAGAAILTAVLVARWRRRRAVRPS